MYSSMGVAPSALKHAFIMEHHDCANSSQCFDNTTFINQTDSNFIFLQWVIVRVDKECASVHLNKDIVPHSLRFKFEVTPSKVTKDIPEFKALTERASAALSSFQT